MNRRSGSITVYLSFIGILIFALLGTLIETARYRVCKNHVARTTGMAAEGLLTEYSRPLYDHYGLFFIESGGEPYEQVMANYIGDTMEAAGQKKDKTLRYKDFLAGHLTDIQLTHRTYVGDDQASALQREITEYMSKEVTKEAMEQWLHNTSKLDTIEKEAKKIEETVDKEKQAAELDEELLELMKLVDGISVSKGKISCRDTFIKCFAVKGKKGQNFGITEALVWKKMKEHIDERTMTWDFSEKGSFLKKLQKVKEKINEGIKVGTRLEKKCKEIGITSNRHDNMIRKIVVALPSLEKNREIIEKTQEMLQENSVKDCKKDLEALWRDYDTTSIVFDYNGVQEEGGGENPKDSLADGWEKGILNLVCKNTEKLSKKSISNPDGYSLYYGESQESQEYEKRFKDFQKEDKVKLSGVLGDMGTYALNEFCLDRYIQKKFGNYTGKDMKWKQALDYGWEYVIAGNGSDIENLKSICYRIFTIRSVINFMALYKDAGKRGQAEAAAIAVVGFTGLQPLITFVKTIILLTWSMVESLVDIAGLFLNRHVPVLKTSADITTTFAQIFLINGDAIINRAEHLKKEGKGSYGYKDYILLFLASTKKTTRLYRIMDLIENTMRKNGYDGFQLGMCVHDIRVRTRMNFQAKFFHFSILEKLLGRNLQNYVITEEITAGY